MQTPERVILFHPELIPLIESGAKTLTYRLDDDDLDYLAVGDIAHARDSATGQLFAELQITHKHWTTFAQLPIDRQGNVAHRSKEAQRLAFKGYYGREVLDSERVLVLQFKVVHTRHDSA
jgi:hypothetical protein